jgi:uncharacterized membrane-anchored protein YitT (DUF2179 family)
MIKRKYGAYLVDMLLVLVGNAIMAWGIDAFIVGHHIITGGVSGIGLIVQNFAPIPVSVTVLVINVAALIVGLFFLGKQFIIGTLVSTFAYPFFIAIFDKLPQYTHLTNDPMLCTIFAGVSMGIGLGIVFRLGYSTGGMDIPPIIINKKTGIELGTLINIIDIATLIGQMPFSSPSGILYGLINVILTTQIIDRMMLLGKSNVQLIIISKKYEEIAHMISEKLDRGFTFLNITTGYLRDNTKAIMVVVSKRQYISLNEAVTQIDPYAFTIVSDVHSVRGRGFTLPYEYL